MTLLAREQNTGKPRTKKKTMGEAREARCNAAVKAALPEHTEAKTMVLVFPNVASNARGTKSEGKHDENSPHHRTPTSDTQ